jgi:O-antigen/teichoic acid export membrane protein
VSSDTPEKILTDDGAPPLPASRSRSLGRHFIVNSAGTIVGLIVSFVTVPIYLHQIGVARYGVLSIVWLLLGYFGFLDLGLSRAATNALARLDGARDHDRSRVVGTSVALNLFFGAIGSLIIYGSGSFLLEHIVSVPDDLRPEIESSLPWVAALLPLALVSGVAVGTLEARERFVAANILQVIGSSAGQIIPVVCAVLIAPNLSVVIPAAVITRVLGVLLICVYVLLKNGPWTAARPDFATAKGLLGYGGWVTVTGLVSPILDSLDQLVIGSTLGVANVTYYAVPMNLVIRSQLFAVALARSLFPRMSRLGAEQGRAISEQALVTLAYGYGALCAPGIILAGPFLAIWLDPNFAETSASIMRILLVGGWVNGLAFIPFSLLQAQGRPDLPAKFHLLEILPFVIILWSLSSTLGLLGAALAWSLRIFVDAGLLFVSSGMRAKSLGSIAPVAAAMLACGAVAAKIPLSFGQAFITALLAGLMVLGLAVVFSPLVSTVVSSIAPFGFGSARDKI